MEESLQRRPKHIKSSCLEFRVLGESDFSKPSRDVMQLAHSKCFSFLKTIAQLSKLGALVKLSSWIFGCASY